MTIKRTIDEKKEQMMWNIINSAILNYFAPRHIRLNMKNFSILIKFAWFMTILISFPDKISTKSFIHQALTNFCVLFKNNYQVSVNATTDFEGRFYGPGGSRNITLPVDINSANKLIELNILDANAETVVIMHGFNDDGTSGFSLEMTREYLRIGSYNVIALNGNKVASAEYIHVMKVVRNYELLGDITAEFLAHLHSRNAINISKVHMIGMSFGAQMVGRTGRIFEKLTGVKLGRITGLDPAGPCFEYTDLNLSKNDAEYVDIIHTNAGLAGTVVSGGHIDFVVNGGGPGQPGCPTPLLIGCNHKRACTLFIESLNQNYEPFYARKCNYFPSFVMGLCDNNDVAIMGYKADRSKMGTYHLRTKSGSPFSLGMDGTRTAGLMKSLFNFQ